MAASFVKLYRNISNTDTVENYDYQENGYFPSTETLGWSNSGYVFKEWNSSRDGTGTAKNVGDKIPENGPSLWYVIWESVPQTIDYLVTNTELTDIADELRTARGTSVPLKFPTDFIAAIRSLYDPLNTFTGAVVRFFSKKSQPTVKIEANFTPIQDLNGYDAPWPPGGGKNKASPLELGSVSESKAVGSTYSEMQISSTSRARTIALIPTNGQQYTVSMDFSTYRVAVASFDENQQYLGKASGWRGWSTVNFTQGGASTHYVALIIKRTDEANLTESDLTNCHLQLEIGTSATTFAPYSNICPISGHTGCEVTRAGKNLMELNLSEMVISGWNVIFPFTIKPGTYKISCQRQFGGTTDKGAAVSLCDANYNNLLYLSDYQFGDSSFVGPSQTVTEAIAAATTVIKFSCTEGIDVDEAKSILSAGLQLEFGSTATEYEAPKGKTVAVHFPALGKNLFDESRYQNLATELEYISNSYRCKEIQLEPYTQYTISHRAGTADSSVILLLNNSKVVNDGGYFDCRTASGSKTYTTDATGKLYIGTLNTSDAANNARLALCQIQIEAGDTATAYEPYINTVYSGTAECNADGTWTVTATHGGTIFNGTQEPGENWQPHDNSVAWWYAYDITKHKVPSILDTVPDFLSSSCPVVTPREVIIGSSPQTLEVSCYNSSSIGVIFRTTNTSLNTKAAINAYLSANPVQVVYELATPLTFTVTASQINTIVGENYVWADCGDIEVQAYGAPVGGVTSPIVGMGSAGYMII